MSGLFALAGQLVSFILESYKFDDNSPGNGGNNKRSMVGLLVLITLVLVGMGIYFQDGDKKLREQLTKAKIKAGEDKALITQLTNVSSDLRADVASLETTVSHLREEKRALESEKSRLANQVNRLTRELEDAEENVSDRDQMLVTRETEIERLRALVQEIHHRDDIDELTQRKIWKELLEIGRE